MNPRALTIAFSPRRRLHGLHETSAPYGGLLGRQAVISRGLCLYRVFDLERVPAGRRQDALGLKIAAWAPGGYTAHYAGWVGGQAHVWSWDPSRVDARGKAVPETALHPSGDGVRLVCCIDGFEGQYWADGTLRKAHWWSERPGVNDWVWFQRAAGLKPVAEAPEAESPPLLPRPWARERAGGGQVVAHEARIVQAVAALGVFALGWQAVGFYSDTAARADLRDQVAQRERAIEPVLQARQTAREEQSRIAERRELFPDHRQLQVMAQVAATLSRDVVLVQWLREGTRLRVGIEGDEPDASAFVRRFQEVGMFDDVSAERGRTRNQLVLTMELMRSDTDGGDEG